MLQIGEMKMSKAAKFDEFLSSNNINCFSKEEIDNEMHSIVYRARCRWRCQCRQPRRRFDAYQRA